MKRTILALVAPGLLALASMPLQAASNTELTVADGLGNFVTVDQTGAIVSSGGTFSVTASGGPSLINFSGSVGAFNFNTITGRGGQAQLFPTLMNLNTIDVLSTGSGNLTITFTDTGYTDFGPVFNLSASSTFTASLGAGSTATFDAYNSTGVAFPATNHIGTIGTFGNSSPLPAGCMTISGGATSCAGTQNFVNPLGPLNTSGSLTEKITLHFATAGEIDNGFTVSNAVPEPASFVFLGSALIGIATLFRKKQRA